MRIVTRAFGAMMWKREFFMLQKDNRCRSPAVPPGGIIGISASQDRASPSNKAKNPPPLHIGADASQN
ncbi:hypothetical protein HYPDE_40848 [Hyphomicrobium denitrificans 1NES1]|uniref:Uncharacterized protein n=1 Tax=Hyphomicrobium denitrificans 1NES1 TaxID=670307 RepID=N0B9Z2_9HYPH|nr:hypothetical protein HYPDE_40848 [Hyphomicrobium denitrificans 1NES1]